MPRQQITFPKPTKLHRNCVPSGRCICTPLADTPPALAVCWGAGGHDRLDISNVQLVIVDFEQPTWQDWAADAAYHDEWMSTHKRGTPVPPVAAQHYSSVLSRSEINDLIRTLRRARGAAYGRDE
jgi:hypothetical protein